MNNKEENVLGKLEKSFMYTLSDFSSDSPKMQKQTYFASHVW